MIRERIASGKTADVLVVPPAAFDDFVAAGRVSACSSVYLGRVGVGIGVRTGASVPDVSTKAVLIRALLDFDSIVINRASSGLYMEGLLERLGVKEQIAHKLVRIVDGPQMMQHIIHGQGREFCFAPRLKSSCIATAASRSWACCRRIYSTTRLMWRRPHFVRQAQKNPPQ